ncbi:hypothetical protein [Sphingomicrobium flavum]|uniref:hypothetical protein n=1 Tax=Sphingomicrobium flavum TaxID=1229164 RepID=UPI00289E66EA|nr:hypothetical protein [Sphingomicrobium flavum]
MLKKIARLFVIKTRFEAYAVTYAIAVGSVSRGVAYLQQYPGWGGMMLFACCLGLPFVAGAKLLDAVRKKEPAIAMGPHEVRPRQRLNAMRPRRHRRTSDNRRKGSPPPAAASRR